MSQPAPTMPSLLGESEGKKLPASSMLVCVFFSGVCGLSYQIVWQALFTALAGSDAAAAALVISVFLLGLAAGNEVGGRVSLKRSIDSLLKAASFCEMFVGLWSFLLAASLGMLAHVSAFLMSYIAWPTAVDLALALIIVLPPAFAMGAVVPLLTEALALSRNPGRTHSLLYGLNTLGAVLGCLACGLYLLPLAGITISLLGLGLVSIVLSRVLKGLARFSSVKPSVLTTRQFVKLPTIIILAASGAGATVFTLEIIALRLFGLAAGSSHYLFSLVVAAFILISGLTSLMLRPLMRGENALKKQSTFLKVSILASFAWSTVFLFLAADLSYLMHRLRIMFAADAMGWFAYHSTFFVLTVALCAPLVLPLSSVVPLLVARYSTNKTVGFVAGRLWKWNAIGCVSGALGAGLLWFSIGSLQMLAQISLISAILVLAISISTLNRNNRYLLIVPFSAALLFVPRWDALRTSVGIFYLRSAEPQSYLGASALYSPFLAGAKSLALKDDQYARVAVVEFTDDSNSPERVLYIDGKPDGNTRGDAVSMKIMGHLPALLSGRRSSSAAVVGFGTGMTAGSLTLYPDITEVDILEISPAVREFAPYFDAANHSINTSQKVKWIEGDAYRTLLQSKKQYAVIASQPSTPWLLGSDRLYTTEFFSAVKNSLAEDGIYAHWIPLYDTSAQTVKLALSTLASVFPHVRTFQFANDIIILASRDDNSLDLINNAKLRMSFPQLQDELKEVNFLNLNLLLAHETWLPRQFEDIQRPNSLYHNKLGYWAAEDFYLGRDTTVSELIQTRADLQNQIVASNASLLSKALHEVNFQVNWNQLIREACGDSKLELVEPTWRFVRSPCRDMIMRAMIEGRIAVPTPAQEVVSRARIWGLQNVKSANYSLQLVRANLEAYLQLNSVINPLSVEPLIKDGLWCKSLGTTEGQLCLSQIVGAFEYFGAGHAALLLKSAH